MDPDCAGGCEFHNERTIMTPEHWSAENVGKAGPHDTNADPAAASLADYEQLREIFNKGGSVGINAS